MKKGLKKEKKKKSGGGPPDLSDAGSREWVSSFKGPSSTRKECPAPMDVCDLKVCIDRYVYIEFQRRETQFGLRLDVWSVYCSRTEGPRV